MTPHATATPIPPGIEVPDEVQTRLGTLRFFDGFPDDATTQTLFDNLDFQRAVQAYLLALPPVDLAALRLALSKWGPVNSTVAVWEDLLHPRTIFLTGNTSTAYVAAWLDLHDGPLVLDAAPGVYGLTSDSWGRWVVDVGLTGPDKGQGGRYLLLPPGYDGDVPDGYFVVRPRTYGMLPALRAFRDEHGDPHPPVEVIKAHIRVYPLAQADDPPPTRFVNVSPEPWVTIPPADYRFWDILNEVVQSEPPESSDPVTLGMFAAVGIQHGRPFALDERMRAILTEAATVGDATARALFYRFRQSEAYYYPDSAWRTVFVGGYSSRTTVSRCSTPPPSSSSRGTPRARRRSRRWSAPGPSRPSPLSTQTARRSTAGRLPAARPGRRPRQHLLVGHRLRHPDPIHAADQPGVAVRDQPGQGLRDNADGSADVYFGPERPIDSPNWIQTLPGKGWYVVFRLYGPLEPWFDKTWRLPDIEPVR